MTVVKPMHEHQRNIVRSKSRKKAKEGYRARDRDFELEEIAKFIEKNGVTLIPSGDGTLDRDGLDAKIQTRSLVKSYASRHGVPELER